MSQVINVENLSAKVVVDFIASNLRDEIVDPLGTRDSNVADFVLTSFPDKGVLYPHIICGERSDSSVAVDNNRILREHNYVGVVRIMARSDTEMFKLRDKVKAVISAYRKVLEDNGFFDIQISSNEVSVDERSEVSECDVEISGKVYSLPNLSV